jgi:hypothetical protein
VRDQVSHPYRTRGKYILIFEFSKRRWEDKKDSELNDSKHSTSLICR